MADAEEPVCALCKVTSSLMWEKNKEGEVLCLECHSNSRQELASTRGADLPTSPSNSEAAAAPDSGNYTGRRTRLRNAKGRYGKAPEKSKVGNSHTPSASASPAPPNSSSSSTGNPPTNSAHRKGGGATGRRSQSKVKPKKAPTFAANVVTSDSILHKGTKYEAGDIVSILDESGKVYYALLRGFLEDQYSEKYAVLTWLVPTTPNPRSFDPSLFVLGPEEDTPKDMECLDFVSHSPQSAGFLPAFSHDTDLARLWSTKRRRIMFTS